MTSIRISMHGITKILLDNVLAKLLIQRKIEWFLRDLCGVGVAPTGESMAVFEQAIRNNSTGFQFSNESLKVFSRDLADITDLVLVGMCDDRKVVEIVGFDSDYWEIWTDDEAVKLVDNFAEGFIVS
jgi:hypothetical protein